MKILVVEDELKTGDYLRQGLSGAGHVVDLARDGLDGLHLALDGDYHRRLLPQGIVHQGRSHQTTRQPPVQEPWRCDRLKSKR